MTTCRQWVRRLDEFMPLCTNEFFPSLGTDGCSICVSPQIVAGVCSACGTTPVPRTYRVTLAIDGNGAAGGTPDYGCGTDYNREFLLYWVSGCTWESSEKEIYSECPSPSSGTDAVTCTTITSGWTPRARVSMVVSSRISSTGLNTVYTVTANWRTDATTGYSLYNNSVSARGYAAACDKPASALFYSRSLRFNTPSTKWANPFVNYIGGGYQLTMTASVAPL